MSGTQRGRHVAMCVLRADERASSVRILPHGRGDRELVAVLKVTL
jgi:hypothetical protein